MKDKPEGYYITFHKSLIDNILMAGVDRNLCFGLWSIGISIGIMLQMYWFLGLTLIVHFIVRSLTKQDDMFFKILVTHIHDKKIFE